MSHVSQKSAKMGHTLFVWPLTTIKNREDITNCDGKIAMIKLRCYLSPNYLPNTVTAIFYLYKNRGFGISG
jgi:hypothetical protein